MYLCIDIGNTRTKLAVFDPQGQQQRHLVCTDGLLEHVKALQVEFAPRAVILSSVGHEMPDLHAYLQQTFGAAFIVLGTQTPIPLGNAYKTPETLGKDRLAVACGARALFPDQACLVVNAGTCITYDFVDQSGVYQGGSITPGIRMRYKALNQFTAKLPLVEPGTVHDFIGKTTEEAILTGVQFAACKEMEGFMAAYEARFGPITILIAGGDAELLLSQTKKQIFAVPNLVLVGLFKILTFNVNITN
jgi:type III pantothenate kinase